MSRERKGLSELRSGKSGAAGPPRRADSPAGPRPPRPLSPCLPVLLSRAELYFLIARFLEDGPCQQAAQVGGARRGPGGRSRWPPAGVGEGGGGGGAAARGAGLSVPALLLQVLIREVAEKEVRARRPGAVPPPHGLPRSLRKPGCPAGRGTRGAGVPGGARGGLGRGAATGRAGGRAHRASCPRSCCPGARTGPGRSTPGPTRIW